MSAPVDSVKNGATASNLGKRKKTRGKTSYLGTWLERAAHHLQDEPDYEYLPPNPYTDSCKINGYCPPEPVSLPNYPLYNPVYPYWPDYRYISSAHKSVQVQRPRVKRTPPNGVTNFNYFQPKVEENNDFASLPPIVTSVGDTTSNSEANEKESGSARRFSDPCLPRLGDGAGSSDEGEGSLADPSTNKVLVCLVDQINALKVANDRLNKDLQETRAELHSVRQQTTLWQKGSTSSLGPANHAPLNTNGYLAAYPAGSLAELVREIREAARLREDAMYARLRALLDERIAQSGLSLDKSNDSRNYEEIKISIDCLSSVGCF